MTTGARGAEHLLGDCLRADADGSLPTCTQGLDGQWQPVYDTGLADAGSGLGGGLAVLFVLALLGGLVATLWRVNTARRMARDAGLDEGRAGTMALLTDDGLEATYLASSLRGGPEPTPDAPPPDPGRPVAERLRELDELLAGGLIDQAEYDETRRAILGSL